MDESEFYIESEGIVFESLRRKRKVSVFRNLNLFSSGGRSDSPRAVHRLIAERKVVSDSLNADMNGGSESMAEACDELCSMSAATNLVMVDIDRLRSQGVPEYVLNLIQNNKQELSKVHIDRHGRILLGDYDMEVRMPPLDKTIYFFFLRHPEGVRFKDLCDHRKELMDLYSSVSGRDNVEAVKASIDGLTDPLNNSINEKCSRIKRAFVKAFGPVLAAQYYIDGPSGEPKLIRLDRRFVEWETIR